MDIRAIGSKIIEYAKKYRYAILILAIGLVLMAIPGKQPTTLEPVPTVQSLEIFQDPTEKLTKILNQISGAGRVHLLLTVNAGEKVLYQTDQDRSNSGDNGSVRIETVIIQGSEREEQGLVQQTVAPEYRGAVVVCQGADDAAVRLAIVEAVSNATGLSTDRISVLKMK